MREPAVDRRVDQIGRKESKRDCHVDLSRAAVFSLGDAVGTRYWISDKFIKPTTANQSRARFRTYRTNVFRPDPRRQEDLTTPSCRCLAIIARTPEAGLDMVEFTRDDIEVFG
jgi:hypothetical protein